MATKQARSRLDKLEAASGKREGMAVYYEGQPTANIVFPKSRQHEEITPSDFETEYPDGVLIRVRYVESPIPC